MLNFLIPRIEDLPRQSGLIFVTTCVSKHFKNRPYVFFSNSRRRHESEEGDSHRRHKHKKSKRSKEGKEAGSEPAPEQESTEAAPAE